jgi:UPF0716 protein FxsA
MLLRLILLFTLLPIIELALLLRINQSIGIFYTMLLVIITGIAGAWLAKSEGRSIISRIRVEMGQGRMPGDELVNGLCVLIGGAFLLTPGIITDISGFFLIFPFTRSFIKSLIKTKMRQMIREGSVNVYYNKDK